MRNNDHPKVHRDTTAHITHTCSNRDTLATRPVEPKAPLGRNLKVLTQPFPHSTRIDPTFDERIWGISQLGQNVRVANPLSFRVTELINDELVVFRQTHDRHSTFPPPHPRSTLLNTVQNPSFAVLITSSATLWHMKKNSTASTIAYVAVFTALIIVFAFVSIPSPTAGVPIVMQNAVIVLAGLVLGGRRGLYVGLLFLLLGLVGLPVLAGGRSALSALAGPTVGYIVGYAIAPFVAGIIAYRAPRRNKGALIGFLILAALAGLATQYLCGSIGLVFRNGIDFGAALMAQIPFLVPDFIKIAVMVAIAAAVHAAFPDLMGRTSKQQPLPAQSV